MFKKLLCAVAFASAALAQTVQIAEPTAGTKIAANASFKVRLAVPSAADINKEVSVVIGVAECIGIICFNNGLGNVLYAGDFNPQSKDSAGNLYQDISVTAPNYFDGTMQLNVAHLYTEGINNYVEVDFVNTTIIITGASG